MIRSNFLRETPRWRWDRQGHLQRIARQAVNSAVNLCNVQDYQDRHDRKMVSLRRQAGPIIQSLAGHAEGWDLALGGDPRGPCCWLKIPGERGDGMDPDSGFAVY